MKSVECKGLSVDQEAAAEVLKYLVRITWEKAM
jgi:hypothetical protein